MRVCDRAEEPGRQNHVADPVVPEEQDAVLA
jgi:hypothetical protein